MKSNLLRLWLRTHKEFVLQCEVDPKDNLRVTLWDPLKNKIFAQGTLSPFQQENTLSKFGELFDAKRKPDC